MSCCSASVNGRFPTSGSVAAQAKLQPCHCPDPCRKFEIAPGIWEAFSNGAGDCTGISLRSHRAQTTAAEP